MPLRGLIAQDARNMRVRILGCQSMEKRIALRKHVKNMPWVDGVQDANLLADNAEVTATYSEKTVDLAAMLGSRGPCGVRSFSWDEIALTRQPMQVSDSGGPPRP